MLLPERSNVIWCKKILNISTTVNLSFILYLFDYSGLSRYLQVLYRVRNHQKKNWIVPTVFENHVEKHPNKAAFIFEGREWTFKEANYSKKY